MPQDAELSIIPPSTRRRITNPKPKLQQISLLDIRLSRKQLINVPFRTHQPPIQPHPLLLAKPNAKRSTQCRIIHKIYALISLILLLLYTPIPLLHRERQDREQRLELTFFKANRTRLQRIIRRHSPRMHAHSQQALFGILLTDELEQAGLRELGETVRRVRDMAIDDASREASDSDEGLQALTFEKPGYEEVRDVVCALSILQSVSVLRS